MNEFFVLKLLDRVQWIFKALGADYAVLRRILQVKLTMDGRRTPTIFSGSQEPKLNMEGSPFRVQWLYLLLGLMLIALVAPADNYILTMSLMFSIVMFMITTTLISDFSTVMLDLRDKNILFSKPVDRRTLNMAKSIHILIYLLTLTLTFTGPSLLFSLFRHGALFFFLYAAEIILMDGFILVFTALVYLLILRFFDGEKLKDIINYVQIILSVGVTVGAQLVSRLFNITEFGLNFTPAWWHFALPPVWFGAPFELLVGGAEGRHLTILAVLALAAPVVLFAAYIRLMPLFESSLQKLAEQGASGQGTGRISRRLSEITCRNKVEAMFFRFTWSMMKHEREFKLRVYPTVGLSLVLPFIFIFNQVWSGDLAAIRGSRSFLFIYYSALLMMTAVQMLRYSSSYKGAWIYKVIPLPGTAMVYRGMLKAVVLKLLVPLFTLEAAVFIGLFGSRIIADMAAVLLALLLYSVLCFLLFPRALPFSEKYEAARRKEFTGSAFVQLFVLAGLAGIHYVFTLIPAGIYIYLVILAAANAWIWHRAFLPEESSSSRFPTLRAGG
ncbi:hypothetical protein QW71_25170 [Paenibacillus sp. IHB B 3415]|uniref:hypothetical protein n=1 Tax=Paenibacillus sp. IHB B 3415 TaxID=867080 RepID=UPI000574A205|nr:hypothetical protein [Paenibacillus sp. IHB B 3415]KHL93147.1 hypothetical protein QW71_25170 [Paenibacillus sp. IHB B 3415]